MRWGVRSGSQRCELKTARGVSASSRIECILEKSMLSTHKYSNAAMIQSIFYPSCFTPARFCFTAAHFYFTPAARVSLTHG